MATRELRSGALACDERRHARRCAKGGAARGACRDAAAGRARRFGARGAPAGSGDGNRGTAKTRLAARRAAGGRDASAGTRRGATRAAAAKRRRRLGRMWRNARVSRRWRSHRPIATRRWRSCASVCSPPLPNGCARHRWTRARGADANPVDGLADQATWAESAFTLRSMTHASESKAGAILSFGTHA
jgi:hypothetical protein